MKWTKRHPSLLCGLLLASSMGLALGCTSHSPSEPRQNPPPTPGSGGQGNFNVTVSVTPGTAGTSSDVPVEVLIRVLNRSSGAPPANGSTAVVSATLGTFDTANTGPTSGPVSLINGEARLLFFPGPTPGTAVIQAEFQGNIGQALLTLQDPNNFFLSFVDPAVGKGGDAVTIHGGGFQRPIRVTFGASVAQVLSVAANRIRVEVPSAPSPVNPNSTLAVAIQVTIRLNEQGQTSDALANGFTYQPGGTSQPQPIVFSVDPPSGPNEGGTRVTVTGDNFEAPARVVFGGVEGIVESVSKTQIVARTPSATALGIDNRGQMVDVTVINVGSGFEGTLQQGFTYEDIAFFIQDISPKSGPQAGGTQVTLTGTGFVQPVRVEMGGFVASVVSVTPTEIVIRTPAITDDALDTETCNDNGDSQDGQRFLPTAVDVTATNTQFNDTDTLNKGFIYNPTNATCRNDVAPPEPVPPPQAAFTFSASGLTVIFVNNSSNFVTSLWDFGDSMTSTVSDPNHTYAAPGTYVVTLTVRNLIGQPDSTSQFVTVPPP